MRDWPSSAARWIRRLIGRDQAPDATAEAGDAMVASGALSVLALEAMACNALCLQTKRGASHADDRTSAASLNAFGRAVSELHYESVRAAFASASGLAMTGSRAATFLTSDRLPAIHDQLFAAAGRRLPLVVHAASRAVPRQSRSFGSGHEGYHAVAATGAFLAFARNVQHAVDLSLAARRVAELSLTPGVVAMDGPETAGAAQDLRLPDAALVAELLGAPDGLIDAPTPAQRMLFGGQRSRVPRWFDLDRPAAFGTDQAGDDYGVAQAGRKLFFDAALAEILRAALAEVAAKTGRPLGVVTGWQLDRAKHVIVTQGSVAELAEAVAAHLAATDKAAVGVLSVDFLRPFPREEVAKALAGADVVTVLERADDPLGQTPPLMADVAAALAGPGPALVSAIYGVGGKAITSGDLSAVFENMARGSHRKDRVFVGMSAQGARSALPKRQVLLDGVQQAYPGLADHLLAPAAALPLKPAGARTVSVHCQLSTVPEQGLSSVASALTGALGAYARSRSRVVAHRVWEGLCTVAEAPLRDLGDALPVDLAYVSTVDLPAYIRPTEAVVAGGALVLDLDLPSQAVWARLPAPWRQDIRAKGLRVFIAPTTLGELGAPLAAVLTDGEHELEAIEAVSDDDAVVAPPDPELPKLIKRISRSDSHYDNPSRFWGEVIQPRVLGERPQSLPDPYLAIGAVPASTATFRDASAARSALPVVDAAKCTGCGECWISCPDSSLGPVAVDVAGLLDAAADLAGVKGGAADKLRRGHGQIAAKLAEVVAPDGGGAITPMMLREAYAWLRDKGTPSAAERADADAAFDATLAKIGALPVAVTDVFFAKHEGVAKGKGEVFVLGVNPLTCQGCTSCVSSCPEGAIAMAPQDDAVLAAAADGWRLFEALPDTPKATVDRVQADLGLAAVHLNKATHLAVAGGSASEPGSGGRLAARLVAGAIEHRAEQQMTALEAKLGDLVERLRGGIGAALSGAFHTDDLAGLGDALGGVHGKAAALGDLVDRLAKDDHAASIDADALRRSAKLAAALEESRERVRAGTNGIGRARMGLVVTAGEVGGWAARFPHNPFYAPLAVDLGGDGAELAAGVCQGVLSRFVEVFRMARMAELRIAAKPDLAAREAELMKMTWRDLTAEELALVPPLVLLADAESLGTRGLSGLSQLLTSQLPVRAVVLDRRAEVGAHVDPTLFALAHRSAFVVAGSIAFPDHLFDGVTRALDYAGPALIHVIAPSPGRDGFATGASRARAREAVLTRVHPLVTYDPSADGVFGARIDLSANPAPEAAWFEGESGPWTPARWAAGHGRGARGLLPVPEGAETEELGEWLTLSADERADATPVVTLGEGHELAVSPELAAQVTDRLANWTTLQELAGIVTPFTHQVRQAAERDLAAERDAALASQAQQYEAKLAAARGEARQVQVDQLRRRLLQLAGYTGTDAWLNLVK